MTTPILIVDRVRDFYRDLDAGQKAWWNSAENAVAVGIIKRYLNENGGNVDYSMDFGEEMINSGINNSAISFSPFFKYPVGSNYKVLYPKLTQYLKEKLPLLKDNYSIINAIKTYTPLTTSQIKKHLSWGNGPTIKIVQLDNFCTECDSNTHGVFQPSSNPNTIFIDIDLVNELENSSEGALANSFAFFIGVTILHEYVHFGDNIDGVDYPGEEGELFEIDVYGQIVTRENAQIILSGN